MTSKIVTKCERHFQIYLDTIMNYFWVTYYHLYHIFLELTADSSSKIKWKPNQQTKLSLSKFPIDIVEIVWFLLNKSFFFSIVLIVIFYWTSNVTSSIGIKGTTMQLLLDWIEDESNFKVGKVIEIFAFYNSMSLRCIGGDIKQ